MKKKYDRQGNFVSKWGSSIESKKPLNHPHGIEIDKQDDVYITDQNNKRVLKFSDNGTLIISWGSHGPGSSEFDMPWDVGVGKGGKSQLRAID